MSQVLQSVLGSIDNNILRNTSGEALREAFRAGVMSALGKEPGASEAAAQPPYAAGIAIAQAAQAAGRSGELLAPGGADVDLLIADAYAQGWSLGRRSGPAPLLAPPGRATGRDRWVNEARRRGFFDARSSSRAKAGSGWGWFGERTTLPAVGSVPNWGVAAGIVGASVLAGYYFTKHHKRSAFTF